MDKLNEELSKKQEAILKKEEELNEKNDQLDKKEEELDKTTSELEDAKQKEEDNKLIEQGEEAIFMKALSYKNEGNYKKAIKYFKLVLENGTQSNIKASSIYQLGLCNEKLNDKDKAISYYKKYVNTYSKDYAYFDDSYYRMGILYYEDNQLSKAKDTFYSLRYEDPDSSYNNTEKVKDILRK